MCVGMMPQRENHNLVIPNHFGSHAKIEPVPFFVVLTVFPVTKGNICYVRVRESVCVCVCVLYTTATTKLTLQIPRLKQIGSENVQDL